MCTRLKRKTFAVGFCRLVSCYTLTGELGKCVRRRQIDNMNTKNKSDLKVEHFCQLRGLSRYLGVRKLCHLIAAVDSPCLATLVEKNMRQSKKPLNITRIVKSIAHRMVILYVRDPIVST